MAPPGKTGLRLGFFVEHDGSKSVLTFVADGTIITVPVVCGHGR